MLKVRRSPQITQQHPCEAHSGQHIGPCSTSLLVCCLAGYALSSVAGSSCKAVLADARSSGKQPHPAGSMQWRAFGHIPCCLCWTGTDMEQSTRLCHHESLTAFMTKVYPVKKEAEPACCLQGPDCSCTNGVLHCTACLIAGVVAPLKGLAPAWNMVAH